MDTIVSLLSACGGTQLACNDDSFTCPGQDTNIIRDSDVSTVMTPGQNVKIRVTKFGSVVSGPFRINVSFTLANDACANAIDVSAGGTYVGTLVLATNDGTATCGASATNPDVWYTYTNSTCNARRLQVTGCGSNSGSGIDTVISILASCGGAELGCNDDSFNICAPATSTLDSVVSAVVLPGQNVKIRVSKFGSRIVNFFYVNVTSTLANDLCADALLVGAGDHGFCNTGAATDGPAACGVLGSDLWYRYTATATGLVTVSTCGPSSFDTALGVYADGCPAGATLACNDDDFNIHCGGGYIRDAWLQFSATSGTTYLIQVGGYASGQGSGTLHIVGAGCHGLCVADVDDGSGTGTPDGGTGIEDLLYYLGLYDAGLICADTDDGSGTGTPDGGVGIEDLLYYLGRYDAGC
jgi:hypothetical protein